jgi:hypothetical protein
MFKKLLGIDVLENRMSAIEQEKEDLAKKLADSEADKIALAAENQSLQEKLAENAKTPKEIATEKGEPWVAVVDTGFADPKNPGKGFLELDWNNAFIELLIGAGYSGRTDEDIIDMWFNDLCRGVLDTPPD